VILIPKRPPSIPALWIRGQGFHAENSWKPFTIYASLQAAAAGRKRESGAQSPAGAFPLLWLGLGDGCKPRKTAESGISRNSRRGWGNPCASWSAFPPFLATTKAIPCHPCSPDERSEIPLKRNNKVDRETFRSCQRSASVVPGGSDSTRWLQFDRGWSYDVCIERLHVFFLLRVQVVAN
jgi:hypothetical protein